MIHQWIYKINKYNLLRDTLDITEIIKMNIFTSEENENMPLESQMWFQMNFYERYILVTHLCLYNKILY